MAIWNDIFSCHMIKLHMISLHITWYVAGNHQEELIYIFWSYHRTSCTAPKEGLREPDRYDDGADINDDAASQCIIIWKSSSSLSIKATLRHLVNHVNHVNYPQQHLVNHPLNNDSVGVEHFCRFVHLPENHQIVTSDDKMVITDYDDDLYDNALIMIMGTCQFTRSCDLLARLAIFYAAFYRLLW